MRLSQSGSASSGQAGMENKLQRCDSTKTTINTRGQANDGSTASRAFLYRQAHNALCIDV